MRGRRALRVGLRAWGSRFVCRNIVRLVQVGHGTRRFGADRRGSQEGKTRYGIMECNSSSAPKVPGTFGTRCVLLSAQKSRKRERGQAPQFFEGSGSFFGLALRVVPYIDGFTNHFGGVDSLV